MSTGLDGLEFLEYLWGRRRLVAAACVCALAITGVVSALLPSRYTATASVLIESPGGNDPRATTAMSPVYLESLKTYELLASSDTLFERALDDLQIRRKFPRATIESLKRRVLGLSRPTNTSILEISATLDDPRQAQALAQYIAEHTVALNAQMDRQSDLDVLQEPLRLFEDAADRLSRARRAKDDFLKASSVDRLSKEVGVAEDLRSQVERQLIPARAQLADELGRQQAERDSSEDARPAWTAQEVAAARARIGELEGQSERLRAELNTKERALEGLNHTLDSLNEELESARTAEEAARSKLNDVRASGALRGVRLKVLDPGIVPQRASFPNTPLNLAAALAFSLAASVVFLAIGFGYRRLRRSAADPVYTLR